MTDLSDILKTQGEHGADIQQLKLDKKALFDIHNGIVAPAITQLEVLSSNNQTTTALLKEVSDQVKGISDKQLACEVSRKTADQIDTSHMSKLQKVSVWTVIIGFVFSAVSGAMVFLYQAAKYMIKAQSALP